MAGVTAEQLAAYIGALEKVIYGGVQTAEYEGPNGRQRVTHHDVDKNIKALNHARARLAELQGGGAGGLTVGIAVGGT